MSLKGPAKKEKMTEQNYCLGTSSGQLLWNIHKILEDKALFPIIELDAQALSAQNPFYGDPSCAVATDIS